MRRLKRDLSMVRCGVAMVALAAMLTGCGVKSEPAFPEGSTYPQNYPAGAVPIKTKDARTTPQSGTVTGARPAGGDVPYAPPPAAIERPVQ